MAGSVKTYLQYLTGQAPISNVVDLVKLRSVLTTRLLLPGGGGALEKIVTFTLGEHDPESAQTV